MLDPSPVYHPRNPHDSAYYRCVEDHFETFEQVYEDRFARQYGFFRPYVKQVIYRYLDCGDLHNGFAGSSAEIVAMSIFWPFRVNAVTSAHLVTRSGSWSLASGSARR